MAKRLLKLKVVKKGNTAKIVKKRKAVKAKANKANKKMVIAKKTTAKAVKDKNKSVKKAVIVKKKVKTPVVKAKKTVKKRVEKPILKSKAKAAKKTVKKAVTASKLISSLPYQEISGETHMNEEYMNPAQQNHFRDVLLNWKNQLLGEMERTVHHMQDEAANFPDPNDRATQEEEFSLELRARDRERKLIKKIDEALQRLDDHEYGYCEGCGVEIGVQRLNARPTATLCIDCKTVDEIREKHYS